MSEHFMQECRVCGRPLRIISHYGGQSVVCRHCGGRFVARDPTAIGTGGPSAADLLLYRVDQLLEMTGRVQAPAPEANTRSECVPAGRECTTGR